jgi:GT2 family glycosyltransferase
MSKTLVGFVTFGGTIFTKELIRGIKETATKDVSMAAIIGKPGDVETMELLEANEIPYMIHQENMGFPWSVNDLYDFAWVKNDYDYLIIAGNDTIPYPYAIDGMIEVADTTDYEWISASQFDVRSLVANFPEVAPQFAPENFNITDFSQEPWKKFTGYSKTNNVEGNVIKDVQNFCLYKKSVFDKIGYTDVNFFPAYFIDNDYARRGVNANLKTCNLDGAVYFHFWSRVVKQIGGGSNNVYFARNSSFYNLKWGGYFGGEQYTIPFNGNPFPLTPNILLPADLKISSRESESAIINYWKNM